MWRELPEKEQDNDRPLLQASAYVVCQSPEQEATSQEGCLCRHFRTQDPALTTQPLVLWLLSTLEGLPSAVGL